MFSLTIKQSFWINGILALVFTYLFVGALLSFSIVGLLIDGIFGYLCWNTLINNHWRARNYPFDRKIFRKKYVNNAKKW